MTPGPACRDPPVVFHDVADRELNDTAAYYLATDQPGLSEAFLAEVERVLDLVAETPLAGTVARADLRQWPLRRFPYSIIYRVLPDHIRVLAIAAQKRRPFYWSRRR